VSSRVAAFFDIDGTITKTTILLPLIWYQRAHLSWPRFALFALGLLVRVPYYLWIDHQSRARFNLVFYRRYAGLNAEKVRAWHRRTFSENLQRRIFPTTLEFLRDHHRQGHRIVLITGGLDLVMQPLAEYLHADNLIATQITERDGVLTGIVDGPAVADERKAVFVRDIARHHDIDLTQSFAYGNSMGDARMMESVGHAVAINPDRRLRRLAVEHQWRIVTTK
jgi:HAD superfamily hydrolase (TIGR01490 family)